MRQACSTSHRRAGTQSRLFASQLHQISPSINALPCQRQHSRQHHAPAAHTLDGCPRSATVACREVNDSHSNKAAAGHHAPVPICMSHHRQPYHAQRCRRRGALQQLQAAAHVAARASEPHVSAAPTQTASSTPPTSPSQPQQQQRPQQPTHWFDSLPEVKRYVHADEWGFSLVGSSLPTGVPISGLLNALPEEVFETDTLRAVVSLVAPLAVLMAGYGWLCYMHSITPWWQLLACWLAIGTAYTGLFQAAHECARGTFMPLHPRTQAFLGSLIMAPSLFSLDAWRARVFNHTLTLNQLHGDTTAWHPVTVADVAEAGPMRRKWLRLITSTPLKLLSSIGEWVRSMQNWDLFTYYYELRQGVLLSWVAPALWLGLALPTLMTCAGGLAGVGTYWLAPWLVFHLWLSTLTLTQHTAPHIPWRSARTHDLTRAVVSGTVTVPLPAWLELLLNHANYNLPQHVTFNGIPSYHAKAATQALREKLWPYMQEAPLTIKLITNHITRWQVYDVEAETYITFDEALERIKAAEALGNGHSPEPATAS